MGPYKFIILIIIFILILGICNGSIKFKDERPLNLTWDQVKYGANVTVCNYGDSKIDSLKASFNSFGFKDKNGTQVDDLEVLNEPHIKSKIPQTLGIGECADVNVNTSLDQTITDFKIYGGQLVISGENNEVIRKDISIDVNYAESAEFAIKDIILNVTNKLPIFSAKLDSAKIPIIVESDQAIPKDKLLGFVYKDGHIAEIRAANNSEKTKNGLTYLSIRIDGLNGVGTYKGSIYLEGLKNDDLNPINVQVDVKHWFWYLIFVLLLGVFLAVIFLMLRDRRSFTASIDDRIAKIKLKYKGKDESTYISILINKNSNYKWQWPSANEVDNYLDNLMNSQIKNYKEHKILYYLPDDQEYQKIIKILDEVEKDIERLCGPYGSDTDYKKGSLYKALSKFKERFPLIINDPNSSLFFVRKEDSEWKPKFYDEIMVFAKGRRIHVNEIKQIEDLANNYSELIEKWHILIEKFKRLQKWVEILDHCTFDEEDEKLFKRSKAKYYDARKNIMNATDLASLTEIQNDQYLKEAYNNLSYLACFYKPTEITRAKEEQKILDIDYARVAQLGLLDKMAPKPIDILKTPLRFLVEASVLIISVTGAVLVEFNQLYYSFGTAPDYITAFLIGFSSTAVINAIKDFFIEIGRR